jgi:hypothetical protein
MPAGAFDLEAEVYGKYLKTVQVSAHTFIGKYLYWNVYCLLSF